MEFMEHLRSQGYFLETRGETLGSRGNTQEEASKEGFLEEEEVPWKRSRYLAK